KGRGIEGARGMAQMMLGEQQLLRRLPFGVDLAQFFAEQAFLEQLLLQPDRHRHAEGGKAARRKGQVGFEQALEFQERLVIKEEWGGVGGLGAGRFQKIIGGGGRKGWGGVLGGEGFFLGGWDDGSVRQESGGAIVVEGGNAEYMQRASPQKMV